MTIEEFIEQTRALHGKYKACYLAVIENDDHYDVEVEIADYTIAGTFDTGHPINDEGLEMVRVVADLMESILVEKSVKVFETRAEWENSSYYTSDEDTD